MTLPETCIRRPVMTTLLMMAFVIFGLFSYRLLPVAAIPRVDFPTIVVSAQLPGASPETMASAVATPLEKQFSTIAGLSSMVSTSGQGVSTITMQFDLDRNIDGAALDVQSAMTTAAKKLRSTKGRGSRRPSTKQGAVDRCKRSCTRYKWGLARMRAKSFSRCSRDMPS